MIFLGLFMLIASSCAQQDGDVRLVNGLVSSAGRAEYYQNGTWGTICDDFWNINSCHAVCRQLGFTGAYQAVQYATFGQGTGIIQLSKVTCPSNASNLIHCTKVVLPTNCYHSEDASCVCCPQKGTSCSVASPSTGCDTTCQAALPVNLKPPTFPTGATQCNFYTSGFGSGYFSYPQPTGTCDYSSKYTCNSDSTYAYESWSSSSKLCSGSPSYTSTQTTNLGRCGGIDCYVSQEYYEGTANCVGTPASLSADYTGGECVHQHRRACDNTYFYSFSYTNSGEQGSGHTCATSEEVSFSRQRINACVGAANSSYKYSTCTNPTTVQQFTNAMGVRISQYSGTGCSGSVDLESQMRTGYCQSDFVWYCSGKRIWAYIYQQNSNCNGALRGVGYFPTGCTNTTIFGTSGLNGAKKWQAQCLPGAAAAPTIDFGTRTVFNAAYFYNGICTTPVYGLYDVVNECDSGIKYECASTGSARAMLYSKCDCSGTPNMTIALSSTCTLIPAHSCHSIGSGSSSSTSRSEQWLSVLSCGTVTALNPADAPGPVGTLDTLNVGYRVRLSAVAFALLVCAFGGSQ